MPNSSTGIGRSGVATLTICLPTSDGIVGSVRLYSREVLGSSPEKEGLCIYRVYGLTLSVGLVSVEVHNGRYEYRGLAYKRRNPLLAAVTNLCVCDNGYNS